MSRGWALVGAAGLLCVAAAMVDLEPHALASGVRIAGAITGGLLGRGDPSAAAHAVALAERGVLAAEAARPALPLAASALLLAFVFGTRAMRASSWRELALHVGLAFVAGVAASWVVRADDRAEVALWLGAVTIAALLSSAPWLAPLEGRRAARLRALASRAEGPLRGRLLRAAALARRAPGRALHRDLDALIAIAERRVEGRGSAALDEDLARALDALRRAARGAR